MAKGNLDSAKNSGSIRLNILTPREVITQKKKDKKGAALVANLNKRRSLTDKLSVTHAPKNLGYYLDKQGSVDRKRVERFKKTISAAVLTQLNYKDKKGTLIREIYGKPSEGENWTFDSHGNRDVHNRVGLADIYRKDLSVYKLNVNGRTATRVGIAGSFYFSSPPGYAAVVNGTKVKVEKEKRSKDQVAALRKRLNAPIKDDERAALKDALYGIPKNRLEERIQFISRIAREEGVNAISLAKILKSKKYPMGFHTLTSAWPFYSLVTWTARFTRINIEKFKNVGLKASKKPRAPYTKEFLYYNNSEKYVKGVKPLRKSTWVEARKGHYASITASPEIEKMSVAAKIKALAKIEKDCNKRGVTPGFTRLGRKKNNSKYYQLLASLNRQPQNKAETKRKAASAAKSALKYYGLSQKYGTLAMSIIRWESNFNFADFSKNQGSSAVGLGQQIGLTYRRFWKTTQNNSYFHTAETRGHINWRGSVYFGVHAIVSYMKEIITHLKSINKPVTGRNIYIMYHDGRKHGTNFLQYLDTRNEDLLKAGFQRKPNVQQRTNWLLKYSNRVERDSNNYQSYFS